MHEESNGHPVPPGTVSKKSNKKWLKIGLVILIIALCGLAGWQGYKIYNVERAESKTQSSLKKNTTHFPLYYPEKLPNEYFFDNESITNSSGVVIYNLKTRDGKVLPVSQQSIPKEFNLDKFYDKQVTNGPHFTTPLGKGAVGDFGKQKIGTLITDKTWIIINNTNVGMPPAELELIIRNFKEI